MKTPVAFFIFRRPDLTRQSFARIREARPAKLYIIADGPRKERAGESALCEAVRGEVEKVDWPCEVIRFYADKNIGCQENIGGGLNKVFAQEERAIIVEDDCLPHPSFFTFCEAMLERYRDEPRVSQVSGLNVLWGRKRFKSSYYFSKYPLCWGWATWADRWSHWDRRLDAWPAMREDAAFRDWLAEPGEWPFWENVFEKMRSPNPPWDTWDYQWVFTALKNRWLSIVPTRNLVTNTGFDQGSTHTAAANPSVSPLSRLLKPPFDAPSNLSADQEADLLTFKTYFLYEEGRAWPRFRNAARIRLGALARQLTGRRLP